MITIEFFVKTVFVTSAIFFFGLLIFIAREEIKSKKHKGNEWNL